MNTQMLPSKMPESYEDLCKLHLPRVIHDEKANIKKLSEHFHVDAGLFLS